MAEVHALADPGLLTLAIIGPATADEIARAVSEHYPHFTGRGVLWDLSRADIAGIKDSEFEQVALAARQFRQGIASRKTAYFVPDPATFVKVHHYINLAVHARVRAEYAAFLSLAEAKRWLASD